jgi:hypothetical protein
MWFVRYNGVVRGSERHHGSSSTGFSISCDYYESSEVTEVHPFVWIKFMENRQKTLIDWKKLDDEDIKAYQETKNDSKQS